MIKIEKAIVIEVIGAEAGLVELEVEIGDARAKAYNFAELTGPVEPGDRVVVNTTAVELGLGTGGRHIVVWNLERRSFEKIGPGHMINLRYTPFQHASLFVEEQGSPYHETMRAAAGLNRMPVIACGLHSQLLPVVATLKARDPDRRVAYVMTDGGALPAAISRTAGWLRREGYLEAVITAGHAFGGDYEAVNIYTALIAASEVAKADITIVAMGPGIAGTGTSLGHTGLEQGQIINAVHSLDGRAIAPLRLGQKDPRERHHGVSHHSVAALTVVSLAAAVVPVPRFGADLADFGRLVASQLAEAGISERHIVKEVLNEATVPALGDVEAAGGPRASTMGRGLDEEPAFFAAAGAAALAALEEPAASASAPSQERE